MRRALLVLILLALLGASPLVQAQKPQPVVLVALQHPDEAAAPGGVLVVQGTARYVTEGSARLEGGRVPYVVEVVERPAWASVVVDPAYGVFVLDGAANEASAEFHVTILPGVDAPEGHGMLKVRVTTPDSMLAREAHGHDALLFRVERAQDCPAPGQYGTASRAASALEADTTGSAIAGAAALAAVAGAFLGLRAERARLARLLLVAMTLLVLLAPSGVAQKPMPSLTIHGHPLDAPLHPGDSAKIRMVAAYHGTYTDRAETLGAKARLEVVEAPPWVEVKVSPTDAVFVMSPAQTTAFVEFHVDVRVRPEAQDVREHGVLVVAATTQEGTLHQAAKAKSYQVIPLALAPACAQKTSPTTLASPPDAARASGGDAASVPAAAPAPGEPTLRVQSAPPQRVDHDAAFVAGGGLLGAGLGLLMHRRARAR